MPEPFEKAEQLHPHLSDALLDTELGSGLPVPAVIAPLHAPFALPGKEMLASFAPLERLGVLYHSDDLHWSLPSFVDKLPT